MDGLDATSFDGCALSGLRGLRGMVTAIQRVRVGPQEACGLTYLNLFTQVGVLTAL